MSALLAQDIMKKDVIFAYEGWSIKYLANFLSEHKVSGVPVIASDHELIGVVSITDIFNFENQDKQGKINALRDYYQSSYGNDLDLLDLDNWSHNAEQSCTVHQIMNDRVISVTPETPVAEVTRVMLNNKIHRVFVAEDGKVSGVISTTNLLEILAEG